MLSEIKNKYAIIGGALGLVAGISFGAWMPSGLAGNIIALLVPGLFGLGVGGGIGWFIGTTVQSPIVGLRLLGVIGAAVLFLALHFLANLPIAIVLLITALAAGVLFWSTQPKTKA